MLELFSDQDGDIILTTISSWDTKTEYRHQFGGAPRHTGIIPPGGSAPWQLLYTIDLSDPQISIQIPGCRFLCLYNPFLYDDPEIQYRLKSDTEVEFIYQEKIKYAPHLFDVKFPEIIPEEAAKIIFEPSVVTFDEELEESWWDYGDDDHTGPLPNRNQLCALAGGLRQRQIPGHTECKACGEIMDYLASIFTEGEDDIISNLSDEGFMILYQICPACYTIESVHLVN